MRTTENVLPESQEAQIALPSFCEGILSCTMCGKLQITSKVSSKFRIKQDHQGQIVGIDATHGMGEKRFVSHFCESCDHAWHTQEPICDEEYEIGLTAEDTIALSRSRLPQQIKGAQTTFDLIMIGFVDWLKERWPRRFIEVMFVAIGVSWILIGLTVWPNLDGVRRHMEIANEQRIVVNQMIEKLKSDHKAPDLPKEIRGFPR